MHICVQYLYPCGQKKSLVGCMRERDGTSLRFLVLSYSERFLGSKGGGFVFAEPTIALPTSCVPYQALSKEGFSTVVGSAKTKLPSSVP